MSKRAPGTSRTEVETPYVLEALSSIATADDDHDVLHEIGGVITARGGPLTTRDRDLVPAHPVERRAAHVERPDIVERLQAIAPAENPDLALVQNGRVRASRRGNIRRRERRARPPPRRDVEDEDAIVVRRALAAADDDDFAPDERGRVRATRWREVALHFGMGPLHRLCSEGGGIT
jgi:hypothetical protein